MIRKYDFYKTKYGKELLIDLIKFEDLRKYINKDESHTLSYYDITFISAGSGNLFIDDVKCNLENNTIIFSSPGQVRKWKCNTIPEGYVLIFEEEFLCSFFNDINFVKKLSYFSPVKSHTFIQTSFDDATFLNNILDNIYNEIHAVSTEIDHMLRALLYQVLIWLDRKYQSEYTDHGIGKSNNYVNEFIQLVNAQFSSQHSVAYYADKLNITAGHLNDIIKLSLQISAKKYIQNRIILEAKRLIKYTDLSISEIAWKLKFEDTSYFVRMFKNTVNCTPLQYRNQNP